MIIAMRTLFLFISLLLALRVQAATITGNLLDITGSAVDMELTFRPMTPPFASGLNTVVRGSKRVTSSGGAFTVVLLQGDYQVSSSRLNGYIAVPTGSGTYNINSVWSRYFSFLATNYIASVTAADTTPSYLADKILAGSGTTIVTNNAGANETLTLSSSATSVNTLADALALTPQSNVSINVRGRTTANDGGGGIFNFVSGGVAATNLGTVFNTSGGYQLVRQYSGPLSVKWFGALADGVTDDRAAFVSMFSIATNSAVIIPAGSYRLVNGVTLPAGATVTANNATLTIEVTGAQTGIQMANNSVWEGGTIVASSTGAGVSGGDQNCFISGNYDTGAGANGWAIRNVTLSATKSDANAIFITGDSYNWIVDGVSHGSSATLGRVVLAHWGNAVTPASGTYHPNNGVIRNVYAGELTGATDVSPVLLSACANILVENVYSQKSKYGFALYAGDYGWTYATNNVVGTPFGGITVNNVQCQNATLYGIYVNGRSTLPSVTHWTIPASINNANVKGPRDGTLSGSQISGVRLRGVSGVNINNSLANGFQYGVSFDTNVANIIISGGLYYDNRINGVNADNSTGRPVGITVSGARLLENGWGTTGALAAGVYVAAADAVEIRDCIFGGVVSDTAQEVGVRIDTTATGGWLLEGNHVQSVKSGGVNIAYSIGNSTTVYTKSRVGENTAVGTATLYTGTSFQPMKQLGATTIYKGSLVPTAGTFAQGDKVWFENPSFGPNMAVATAAGTPGTWYSTAKPESISNQTDPVTITLNPNSSFAIYNITSQTTNTTVAVSGTFSRGDWFVIVKNTTAAFTVDVNSLITLPAWKISFAKMAFDGAAWRLISFGGDPAGAPAGTMVNSGASTVNALPRYNDGTGTNLSPTQVLVSGLTNLSVPGAITAHSLTVTNSTDLGTESLSGTTPSIDWNTASLKRWTLAGASTPTFANTPAGSFSRQIEVQVVQPASHTVTWPGGIDWGASVGYGTPSSGTNIFLFNWNGSALQGSYVNGPLAANNGLLTQTSSGFSSVQGTASGDIVQYDGSNWVRLPKGTSGDVLTAGASTNSWATPSSSSSFARYITAEVGATNTVTQTTLFSVTIPGGTLRSTNVLDFRFPVYVYNFSGSSHTITIDVAYGATTVITGATGSITSQTTPRAWDIWGVVGASGTTSKQRVSLSHIMSNSAGSDSSYGSLASLLLSAAAGGKATEDSTADKTFSIKLTMSAAAANFFWYTDTGGIKQ